MATTSASEPFDIGRNPPAYQSEDLSARILKPEDLPMQDRFWPYQVELVAPSKPIEVGGPFRKAAQPLPAGLMGVLIRVENPDEPVALIDFGRDGLHEVALADTDVLDRANRIRRGELDKVAGNFVMRIGTRLVDSTGDEVRYLRFEDVARYSGFVCVFADPSDRNFGKVAASLAAIGDHEGMMTILFPQGSHTDQEVRERLIAAKWRVPFVMGFLSGPYTEKILPKDGAKLPALMLQTREGRVLFRAHWSAAAVSDLEQAIASAPQPASVAAAPVPVH